MTQIFDDGLEDGELDEDLQKVRRLYNVPSLNSGRLSCSNSPETQTFYVDSEAVYQYSLFGAKPMPLSALYLFYLVSLEAELTVTTNRQRAVKVEIELTPLEADMLAIYSSA